MTNLLFVCSANRLRSPTAEQIFARLPGIETDSAGLLNTADIVLSGEQVEWADIIFVMEKRHRAKLSRKYARYLKGKRIVCLDIPDEFQFMQPELVALLERKVTPFLKR